MKERRQFIKNGVMFLTSTGSAILCRPSFGFPSFKVEKWAMIIDSSRCMGCSSCMVSCKYQNYTVKGKFNTQIIEKEEGTFPNVRLSNTLELCRQCSDPACMKACVNNAISIDASGIVLTDWNECDGNGACISACPHNARFHDDRFENRSDKCDFCASRLAIGFQPACVENCSSGARIFGRLDKPEGEFKSYLKKIDMKKQHGAVLICDTSKEEKVS